VTTRVALLGFPVGHSRSPAMHNEAFRERRLDWRYEAIEVEPERFESLARELPGRGFAWANVTIPHKLKALSVADSATTVARAVGAANTLRFGDGHISADNTDVDGFLRALQERAPGAPAGMNALVIGAGGAGRAVVYALLDQGAAGVAVWNRHADRAPAGYIRPCRGWSRAAGERHLDRHAQRWRGGDRS
jgi:shikimate dehydrogenase